jgi:site-specific DNA recombinase
LQENDPTGADLALVDRSVADVRRRQANGPRALLDIDDPETSAPIRAQLTGLGERLRQLEAEREAILERRQKWEAAQRRLQDVRTWCATVGGRLQDASYERRRLVLAAFDVRVTIYPVGHDPRYIILAEPRGEPSSDIETTCTLRRFSRQLSAVRDQLRGALINERKNKLL